MAVWAQAEKTRAEARPMNRFGVKRAIGGLATGKTRSVANLSALVPMLSVRSSLSPSGDDEAGSLKVGQQPEGDSAIWPTIARRLPCGSRVASLLP
jgi:hypothetical protein